ncbi:hypothetical protein WMY93_026663 [Mugilogobius chulae]|uniref:procollagen-proline 3-dioxygenase n=1 Tax=Mugilogobius chulae TaxID=88201 RepID=A0AAW0MY11_9GOBI
MALLSPHVSAYVAPQIFIFALFHVPGVISSSSSSLGLHLQPYDFLYYSGVRAYFGGEWVKAAELLEKSLLTKETLFKVRRECHDECESAGTNALHKLALSLQILSCKQSCVTQVATRPGRVSAQEDFLPTQLEHLHIAQFKAGDFTGAVKTLRSLLLFYPTDKDNLDNLQLYSETLEGDKESLSTQPQQEALFLGWCDHLDDDDTMNGTNRVVLDGVMTEKECDTILQLASAAGSVGDGYRGRRSPHTPHETFEGLTVLRAAKLGQEGFVNESDAKLLHELGERARTLLHSYFRSPSGLYVSFTHLVCRSAVAGDQEGRMDLSHPVHVDNCILEPETKLCWREPPAFTHRDLSAVLYLNDNFDGGELFFTNRDAKTVTARVKPSCGRLVGFSSGPVNPHGVTAVTRGKRCALALWFTKEKLYRDMEREEAEALWSGRAWSRRSRSPKVALHREEADAARLQSSNAAEEVSGHRAAGTNSVFCICSEHTGPITKGV